ncbi:hypothetical protein HDU67_006730 [Dinochytrium kinnereticum]|nr:hypothetical protein HDU67_006730 [Dinochytrium kinnereticum]
MSAKKQQLKADVSDDGVMRITLDNPKRANALSQEMCSAFLEALDLAEKDVRVRVVVLTGSGKYFCSGMDLATASNSSAATPFDASLKLFQRLSDFPKPTIARLNGPALGGGVGLAFSCDIRCADPSTFFQLAEVRRGLIPAIISIRIVPEIGPRVARRWFMTGEKVPCEKLKELGVVDAVGFVDETASGKHLDQVVDEFVGMLREGGPNTQGVIKELIRVVGGAGIPEEIRVAHVKKVFEAMLVSDEASHGMSAFMQKQRPNWAPKAKI